MMDELEVTCKVHSGIKTKVATLEKENEEQWHAINGIKKWIMATLVSTILTLVSVMVGILVAYMEARGGN